MLNNSQTDCVVNCLQVGTLIYSGGPLIVFQRAWNVLPKICPQCCKQVITLSPCRIKDKFSRVHIYKVFTKCSCHCTTRIIL